MVLVLGLAVLLGWIYEVELLKSVLPGAVTMKPNAAVGFVLFGAALVLGSSEDRRLRVGASVTGMVLAGLAVVTLAQDVVGFETGIDQALVDDDQRPTETGRPGRPAPESALAFLLLAGALLARNRAFTSQALALGALALGSLSLLGYAYGAEELYRSRGMTAVALHTSLGLIAAASGALFLNVRKGVSAALLDPGEPGRELRRLLPVAIAIPIASGAIALAAARSRAWDPGLEAAILAISAMMALLGAAFVSFTALRRSETRRLEVAASLADSEARYRRSFENVTIGMAHLAPDGRWLRANARLTQLLGYEEHELRERTYAQVSHLEDLELDVKEWELLRRGEISEYGTERRFITKAGEQVVADVRLVREEDASGELVHFIAVVQDITGRKLSEATLRLYERALAATQNGIVIVDALRDDQPIIYVNRAFLEITGYDVAEVIGRNCRFLNQQARDQAALDEIRRALRRGDECSVLLRNHRKDGEAFWNQLSIAPVKDELGRLTHFVGVLIDATEQVRAATEREELLRSAETANRAKDRFLSVVSHELRSPLNAVLAWTSLLRDTNEAAGVARAVGAIEASVQSQTRLVDDLLEASRMQVGSLEIDPVRIELVALIQGVIDQLTPVASEQGVRLVLEAPRERVPALLDPERAAQIVRNLLDNALKFTPRGGRIDVCLRLDGAQVVIEIRDTGRGIAAEELGQVFDEFWQGERKGSSGGKGLGLGLAVVRHLVERQGGQVEAESEGIDRGACFRVRFPRASDTGDSRERGPEPDASPLLRAVEIVVVDDEEAVVESIVAALRKEGAIAQTARSVPEALRLFERGAPDVLVSDIGLPDRDGLDLIRSVREMPEPKRSVLALAVTGFADRSERRRIQRAGFDAYLAKPVEPAVVVDRIVALAGWLRQDKPRMRRLLLVGDGRGVAGRLRETLEGWGHGVRQAEPEAAVAAGTSSFRPELVFVCLPAEGLNADSLAERFAAHGLSAPMVGVLDDDETAAEPFDFVLRTPVSEVALRRLVQLAGEAS